MEPIVSVVIPVYNRAHLISSALGNALAQTFRALEVVVVDDASTDGIAAATAPFLAGDRVRLIRHDRNQGVSAARNTGVRESRGRFVAFLDSDDSWEPRKIERQMRAMEQHPFPDRVLCVTETRVLLDDGSSYLEPRVRRLPQRPFGDYLFCDLGFVQASAMLLSRSLAAEIPFRTDLKDWEDHAFVLELMAKGVDFLLVPEPLTVWRNDARTDRLSGAHCAQELHRFLQIVEPFLSQEARLAFETRFVLPLEWHRTPLHAVGTLVRAIQRRAVSLRTALMVLSQCLIGVQRHAALRARYARAGKGSYKIADIKAQEAKL